LIRAVIAFWLSAAGTLATPREVDQEPVLSIDPCVAVDEPLVREVMALELRDARARNLALPDSVTVRCVGELQEIRVEPWASTAPEGIRTIQLAPIADDADAPVRQARSRELALAIAEFVRRLEIASPPIPEQKEPPPPPPQPPPPVIPQPQPAAPFQSLWEIGLLSRFEHFAGGQNLAGGDLFVSARLGRWFLAEVNAGGRLGADVPLPEGRLTARAGAAGAALGVYHLSRSRSLGAALVLRAQGYLIQFRAEQPSGGSALTALLGVCTLAAEPRLTIAVTRHLWLEGFAAVGAPLRGIVVRIQGAETKSTSGLVVSGSLGGGVTF
jgi:hypothetical protein